MKKITYVCLLIGTFGWLNAQVLNQSAGWPNAAWTITGSYATGATAFESNPTVTANFAFDDDDAGQNHEDNIAAESPVINLTAAHTAGETWLSVTVQYGYRYVSPDQLRLEYWNAATSTWVAWGGNIPGNNGSAIDNFCAITKETYNSIVLNIAAFTPTQLSGFKYRIAYDDNPAGIGWNWGFCFDSPTITSATPPPCPTPTVLTAVQAATSAVLSWTENGSATLYNIEYGANGFTQGTGTVVSGVSNSYNLSPLTASTQYSYYVQAACGGVAGNSAWAGPFNFTTRPNPPANDECSAASEVTVNPDYVCTAVTPGTVLGATASSTDAAVCGGSEDDDVWFSFVATSTSQRISLTNVAGSVTDMFHSLWTGDCSGLTLVPGSCSDADISNPAGLTPNQTYYLRVYTTTATIGQNTTFNVCIGTPPPPPANDSCSGAVTVTCGSATLGTTANATNELMNVCGISGLTTQNSAGVWYKYVGDGRNVTITTCSPNITTGDSRIAVFTGACGSMTCIRGNDDAQTAGCSTNTLASIVNFDAVLNTEYYILVYSYTLANPGTNAINFELNVTCAAPCTPATTNDECATASALTLGTTVTGAENLCSSPSLAVTYPTCGNQFATYYDTWYSFTTESSNANYTITLANPTGTTGYALYSGSCGALTMVTGSCATGAGNTTVSGLATSTVYYLRAFSTAQANRGSFDLTVSSTLGNDSFDSSNFAYYPNPVTNVLNLSYNKEISNIEIYNLLGQKVIANKSNTNNPQVDMSALPNGTYMVKVTSENQVKTIKVIKQ